MDDLKFLYLCIGEFVIIMIIVIIRTLVDMFRQRKLKKAITNLTSKINDNRNRDKLKECLDIIEQNKNKLKEEDSNGK